MIEAKKNTIVPCEGWSYKYGIPFDSAGIDVNHEKLADIIVQRECEVASVMIVMNQLGSEHWDDPKYMRRTSEIGASEVEIAARERMTNRYPAISEIDAMLKEWGIPSDVDNFSKGKNAEEQNSKRHSKLLDLMFEAYTNALYPEIIEEFREGFKEDWKAEKKKGNWADAWEKEKIRLLAPCIINEYERVYNMPDPYNHWDRRNPWAQFYLVGYAKKIAWVQGGGAGSLQRELHGRWGHTFAALAKKGIEAPTYCYRYTADNEFILEKTYEKFRVHRCDLTGNYPADWNKTKDLFPNRLLSTTDGKIIEIKGT
jgi:hypothetical protein